MNLLAVVGSARKGKSTDVLVDMAVEGAKDAYSSCAVNKIYLHDYDIKFCRDCLACFNSTDTGAMVKCSIRDDMDVLYPEILKSDYLIFGTPVHTGFAPGIMTTFLERICWVYAKPERKILNIKQCPLPRSEKKRKAVIIITSGIIPPVFRRFCDQASPLIRGTIKDSLNAKTVGDLYAGNIMHRGTEYYHDKAFKLGRKLTGASRAPEMK